MAYLLNGRYSTGDFEHHYVYAIFFQDGNGPGYIKFGRSKNPSSRLTQIRTACPIPAKRFATVEIGPSEGVAQKVERAILDRFSDRKIKKRGEWFRFDFSDPNDKREFNSGTKSALERILGSRHGWWEHISVPDLDQVETGRRAAFAKTEFGKKVLRRQDARRNFKAKAGI